MRFSPGHLCEYPPLLVYRLQVEHRALAAGFGIVVF